MCFIFSCIFLISYYTFTHFSVLVKAFCFVHDYQLLQLPYFTLLSAPPSPPKIYLRIPQDPKTGRWALLCLTWGFHPNKLNLIWTYQSTAAKINHLSVTNCTLPALTFHSNLSEHQGDGALLSSDWLVNSMPAQQSKCFQVMDNHSHEVFLFSVFFLPPKQSLDTGVTFTCEVRDHPAITTALTASFTWGKSESICLII